MIILFQTINQLVVDILVGIILACVKAVLNLESPSAPNESKPLNQFSSHHYNHWEQAVLWLEDMAQTKSYFLNSQVQFITTLIGSFYGIVIGVGLLIAKTLFGLNVPGESIIIIGLLLGVLLGWLGGKSLTNRSDIFDVHNDQFKGEHFDR